MSIDSFACRSTLRLTASRLSSYAALGIALAASARAEEPARADNSAPEPAARATTEALPLPLSLPHLKLLDPFTTQYWLRLPDGLSAFRDEPQVRLRLDVETYQVRWGTLVLAESLEIAPPDEGSMPAGGPPAPSARASDSHGLPRSTSVIELKLDLGEVAPAKDVAPFMRVGAPAGSPGAGAGFMRFGLGGKW